MSLKSIAKTLHTTSPYVLLVSSVTVGLMSLVFGFSDSASDTLTIESLSYMLFANVVLACLLFPFTDLKRSASFVYLDGVIRIGLAIATCTVQRDGTSSLMFPTLYATIFVSAVFIEIGQFLNSHVFQSQFQERDKTN